MAHPERAVQRLARTLHTGRRRDLLCDDVASCKVPPRALELHVELRCRFPGPAPVPHVGIRDAEYGRGPGERELLADRRSLGRLEWWIVERAGPAEGVGRTPLVVREILRVPCRYVHQDVSGQQLVPARL